MIYPDVARSLAAQWRERARGLDTADDDNAAMAYTLGWCAGQLESLADVAEKGHP